MEQERIKKIIDILFLILLLLITLRYTTEVGEIKQQCNDYIIEVNEYIQENCNGNTPSNDFFIISNETFLYFDNQTTTE